MNQANNLNIYQKLATCQAQIGRVAKKELNKFQNYQYFTEYQILIILKPLLAEQKLTLTFSDSEELSEWEKETGKGGREWVIKYKKLAIFTNPEKPEEQLTFNFWALGQNSDIAKAKGSADTYAIKYFLSKFFLIPTTDNLDPDQK